MRNLIRTLYENEGLLVVDKPSGLLVVPSPRKKSNTLADVINRQHASSLGRWYPCHRLDRETSGAIIFARGRKMQLLVSQQFKDLSVKKKYIAFVKGVLKKKIGKIDRSVRDYHQRKFSPHAGAKQALTEYKVLQERGLFSVLEVWPKTGRTNQIRIHLSEMGHPLLGERVYAFRKDFSLDFSRLGLHAQEIIFSHPISGKKIKIISELPEDMRKFLAKHQEGDSSADSREER